MGTILALMKDMACIQQAINRIREIGRAVNLSAINAGLAVRSIGSAGLGFSVAAQELRVFSVKLNTQTGVLSSNIGEVVNSAAHLVMQTRQDILLRQALELSGGSNKTMRRVVALQNEYMAKSRSEMDRSLNRLENSLRMVRSLGTQGLSLTRSARVEAAYTGTHQRRLTAVAADMENVVTEILVLNKNASSRLEARQ